MGGGVGDTVCGVALVEMCDGRGVGELNCRRFVARKCVGEGGVYFAKSAMRLCLGNNAGGCFFSALFIFDNLGIL